METISVQEADQLVLENRGWAESIARSVARAWNMDWQLDGLDGAAMEALIFCARRFEPARGVPFRGYARKRIHEASTEAARKTKGWRPNPNSGVSSTTFIQAREISAELLNVFPDLRNGEIPLSDDGPEGSDQEFRAAIRQLIVGASVIATRQGLSNSAPDEAIDYKRMISALATLDPVHQEIMWRVYWEDESMRNVSEDWKMDELNVIREHKVILAYLAKLISTGRALAAPRVRPGLKHITAKLKRARKSGRFAELISKASSA